MLNTVPLHQGCKYQLSSTRCSSWWNSSISATCHNTLLSAVLQLHMHFIYRLAVFSCRKC